MPAEQTQEIGRQGVLSAIHLLWRIFGDDIKLPFNAYDHAPKLTFPDLPECGGGTFSFDLRGVLQRPNANRFNGVESVEVFVEVKSYADGNGLLLAYKEFLRRAAIVTKYAGHHDTWFVFLASVPFGTSKGAQLCNREYFASCRGDWPQSLRDGNDDLYLRISLLIVTASFRRMLSWFGDVRRN
jgi:hypothetical protein